MKTLPDNRMSSRRTAVRAFTVIEMLIAFGIFSMVVAAMVYTQIFGLRMYTLAATKLSATRDGRQAMNVIRKQIREAKTLTVGNCTVAGNTPSFTADSTATNAVGNALQIYPTTNTTTFILFYLDSTSTTNKLKMCTATVLTSGTNIIGTNFGSPQVLASYITNTVIFSAEDYNGHVLNNDPRNNRVYGVTLEFYQWEYPVAGVGPGNMYDFYHLRTRATRRATD